MIKFYRAQVPESEYEKAIADTMLLYEKEPTQILNALNLPLDSRPNEVRTELANFIREHDKRCEHWRNDLYQVAVYRNDIPAEGWPHMTHLSIKRNDRQPIHDWRDLQEIKNQLCGAQCEAVELYPAESRKVDAANQFHLWVLDPGLRFPFGFDTRLIADSIPGSTSQQRPVNENAQV